jgi:hypothetical protein
MVKKKSDKYKIIGIALIVIGICISIISIILTIDTITNQFEDTIFEKSLNIESDQVQNMTTPKLNKGTTYEVILEFRTSNTINKIFNANIEIINRDQTYFEKNMTTTNDVDSTSYIPSKESSYLKIRSFKALTTDNYHLSIEIIDIDNELNSTNPSILIKEIDNSNTIPGTITSIIISTIITVILIIIGLKLIYYRWNKDLLKENIKTKLH